MARDSDTIFQFLLDQKNADPILSLYLTSSSKASFYQSLFALYADATADFELTFDDFEATIETLLVSKQVMNNNWWQRISLEYQVGDPLVIFDNGNLLGSNWKNDKFKMDNNLYWDTSGKEIRFQGNSYPKTELCLNALNASLVTVW